MSYWKQTYQCTYNWVVATFSYKCIIVRFMDHYSQFIIPFKIISRKWHMKKTEVDLSFCQNLNAILVFVLICELPTHGSCSLIATLFGSHSFISRYWKDILVKSDSSVLPEIGCYTCFCIDTRVSNSRYV